MTRTFAVTYDYLCPFARNANEHIVRGLEDGADWDVTFTPFSLSQVHVEDDEEAVWDRDDAETVPGILALEAGLAVREDQPERFLDAHLALFAARHDEGEDITDRGVVREALAGVGVDVEPVLEAVDAGDPLDLLREEHRRAAKDYEVWGVPTFIAGDRGVFIRLMERADGTSVDSEDTIDRLLDMIEGWPVLHEFKQADLPV